MESCSKVISKPIIVIVGQTASGKTGLSISLAKKFKGEVLCADSRTIYKGMDIGTAKPSRSEQGGVAHFGLDLVSPSEHYSAADFKRYAKKIVSQIHGRDHLPIIVGGSGLYVDGFIYDFSFAAKPSQEFRQELERLRLSDLQVMAEKHNISPERVNFANARHLSRAIERAGQPHPKRSQKPGNVLILGLQVSPEQLKNNIEKRVDNMLSLGLVDEVRSLIENYGPDAPALLAPGYKAMAAYLNEQISLEEAKQQFIKADKQLAKRQKTWFKRNQDIVWCSNLDEVEKIVSTFVSEFDTIAT